MPFLLIFALISGILTFAFSSFATFRELKKYKNRRKKPKFLKYWHKIKKKLD